MGRRRQNTGKEYLWFRLSLRLKRESELQVFSCCRHRLSGTTGHRLLGTQRPQMLYVAAWVWFSLTTEFVADQGREGPLDSGVRPCRVYTGRRSEGGGHTDTRRSAGFRLSYRVWTGRRSGGGGGGYPRTSPNCWRADARRTCVSVTGNRQGRL